MELQNGCLSRGHSNLFIPSTLSGSCIDPATGLVNKELLSRNHHLAIDTLAELTNAHVVMVRSPYTKVLILHSINKYEKSYLFF